MSDEPATAPAEVELEDGQVLKHTTAPEHRRRRRRIVAPKPPETEAADSESAEAATEDAAPVDPMQRIVSRHVERIEQEEPTPEAEIPDVEFVSEAEMLADGLARAAEAQDDEDEEEEDLDIEPPPMEPRKLSREKATVGDVSKTRHSNVLSEPRSLEELSGHDFNGQWYLRVIRKEPKVGPNGKRVDGEQKPIKRYITTEEFADLYGGLVYELTLFGPPKQGPKFDGASRPIFRPWSKPFTMTVPGALPNPEMCIGYKGEDSDMTTGADGYRPRPGLASNADARMHEADLEHKRHIEEKREDRARQARERQREQDREQERQQGGIADAFARMHQTSTVAQNEMYQTLTSTQGEMIKALAQGRPGASPDETRYLHQAIERMQATHQELVNRLNESHSAQLERLQTQNREELARLDTQHRAELSRLQDQVATERTRCDETVRTAERNFNDRLREAEKRSDKEISDARRDATERVDNSRRDFDTRIADLSSRHADRHQDLKENHERDLKNRDGKWEMQIASERAAFDSRMAVKDHELKMLREESNRLRAENDKPIHERVREITETAEALGMKRPEDIESGAAEPQTWQQMALEAGSNVLQQLPQLITSASEAVERLRRGGTPAQQEAFVRHQQAQMTQAAAQHPAAMPPPAFAMEGEDDYSAYTPGAQMAQPMFTPAALPPEAQQQGPLPADQGAFITPAVTAAPPAQPSTPSMAPAAAPPPPPSIPPANGAAVGPDPAMDPYILQYQGPFEQAMAADAKPRELAEHLLKTFPPAMIGTVVPMISPEAIRAVLQRNGQAMSPLCRRDGQKYLRAVKAELEALIKAQA